ncbi:hypothetical protein [Halegenticoccus tardaugens]|uniref:hypothetical protein n=1 Tax=Halegenticoccus tardaugens TaxID=2071624 RepID=UPI00100B83A3|nr:hypothetical protein [Halegenticoccus tardaugens]
MSTDDVPEFGRDADATPAPRVSSGGEVSERSWRRLGHELTHAGSVRDCVGTVERYGWLPPLLGLLVHGLSRGIFEHLAEPFAMSQGYVFAGWPLALGINLFYGLFFVGFTWFLYFGVVGALAGYFSEKTTLDTTVFKIGGYLTLLFVPLVALAAALALTIPAPDPVIAGAAPATEVAETHRAVRDTIQMRIVDVTMAGGWILVGVLMLPVVSELYDVDKKASVLSVLPVTLVAVTATQLL